MSYVDDLVTAYRKFVALPWQQNLAPPQRVWMAVYPPEHPVPTGSIQLVRRLLVSGP